MKRPLIGVLAAVLLGPANLGTSVLAAEDLSPAEREVMATLDAVAAATIAKDVAALDSLYHPELTYNHSTGMTQNKHEVLRDIPKSSFVKMEFSEPRIRFYGAVAVAKVTCDLRYFPGGVAADRHLNQLFVLIKESGRWRIVAKHTTRIQS